jgi:hypothetical protein
LLKIKQQKFIRFSIILLGVILLGMPAVYAGDAPPMLDQAVDEVTDESDSDEAVVEFLGSTTQDFVFSPVTPCTIVDTRVGGGGFISAGAVRAYNVHGNLAGQGGSNCTAPRGEPRAVLLNVVAVDPNGKGNLNVVPYGINPRTQGALSVNFNVSAGTNLANAGVIKTAYLSASDIALSANYSGCHAFILVLGYFYDAEPEKITALHGQSPTGSTGIGTSYTTVHSVTIYVPYSGGIMLNGSASFTNVSVNYLYCRFTENGTEIDKWYFGGGTGVQYKHMSRTFARSVTQGTKTYALQCYRSGGTSSHAIYKDLTMLFVKEGM